MRVETGVRNKRERERERERERCVKDDRKD